MLEFCEARCTGGSFAINCVTVSCAIFRPEMHLNFTALTSLLAFSTQYVRLNLAVVVASPGCPQLCMWLMINKDIPWSLGSSAGCFSSYGTIALAILPPTLIIPLPSTNGLNVLNSPFSSRLCRILYAPLINNISSQFAFASSSGVRGILRPPSLFLRERIFSANLPSHAVTRISFRQLVKTFGSNSSFDNFLEKSISLISFICLSYAAAILGFFLMRFSVDSSCFIASDLLFANNVGSFFEG